MGQTDRFNYSTNLRGLMALLQGVIASSILDERIAAKLAGIPLVCAFSGDPVNMSTGNFIYSKEDILIPGRFPLSFKRFYNAIGGAYNFNASEFSRLRGWEFPWSRWNWFGNNRADACEQ